VVPIDYLDYLSTCIVFNSSYKFFISCTLFNLSGIVITFLFFIQFLHYSIYPLLISCLTPLVSHPPKYLSITSCALIIHLCDFLDDQHNAFHMTCNLLLPFFSYFWWSLGARSFVNFVMWLLYVSISYVIFSIFSFVGMFSPCALSGMVLNTSSTCCSILPVHFICFNPLETAPG
jgi:hypothetical protein